MLRKRISLIALILVCVVAARTSSADSMPSHHPYASQQTPVLNSLVKIISYALINNSALAIALHQVSFDYGQWQAAMGLFDTTLNANGLFSSISTTQIKTNAAALGISANRADASEFNMQFNKLLPNGFIITPTLRLTQEDSTLRDVNLLRPENRSTLDFALTIPLLEGKTLETTAPSRAAHLTLEATRNLAEHQSSIVIADTATAYWNYLAARKNLVVLRQAEKRASDLLRGIKLLIKHNEMPRSEINLASANYLTKQQTALTALDAYYSARTALAKAIGLPKRELSKLKRPTRRFPRVNHQLIRRYGQVNRYIKQIKYTRRDLHAEWMLLNREHLLMLAANAERKPNLDFTTNVGYSGLHEGSHFFKSAGNGVRGPDYGFKLTFTQPLQNNTANGNYESTLARYLQQAERTYDLARVIALDIELIAKQLKITSQELKSTAKTIKFYKKAVSDEKIKFAFGASTLVNVIQVEDNLRDSQLKHILEQQSYSILTVQFRFQAGLLVKRHGDQYHLSTLAFA